MSDVDEAAAAPRLGGGHRGEVGVEPQVDRAFLLLVGDAALACHGGDGLIGLNIKDNGLMDEASGPGEIRWPSGQIGEVVAAAQALAAGVGAGEGIEPGGAPFKAADAAWSGVAGHR